MGEGRGPNQILGIAIVLEVTPGVAISLWGRSAINTELCALNFMALEDRREHSDFRVSCVYSWHCSNEYDLESIELRFL